MSSDTVDARSQWFSDPGKKELEPILFWGLDHFCGAAAKKQGKKGATEQLSHLNQDEKGYPQSLHTRIVTY